MAKIICKLSTLTKLLKLPFKALVRARDMYVNSITSCAGKFGGGAHPCVALPRSFSVSFSTFSATGEEDLRELTRVASAKAQGGSEAAMPKRGGVRRSRSAKIGRIDEDEPYDKFDDEKVKVRANMFPRSRSFVASGARACMV